MSYLSSGWISENPLIGRWTLTCSTRLQAEMFKFAFLVFLFRFEKLVTVEVQLPSRTKIYFSNLPALHKRHPQNSRRNVVFKIGILTVSYSIKFLIFLPFQSTAGRKEKKTSFRLVLHSGFSYFAVTSTFLSFSRRFENLYSSILSLSFWEIFLVNILLF